ncbi:acyltransferase family protein [Microbacterium marinilacus]|uniref:Acyltransferase family protein n=1 Tax=Microbacterium marinilacus TaxID=415209 RepID=A0ABP7BDB0_9MICO|nr:acyltransferase family protein [Microbacterium marinilacus]MBY0690189.1 acyltransferase [Microbacterium marinilacus]
MSAGFRPEIQALRAVAVLLVVLFHLWPDQLTGGYIGVDVFFVISGYLITSHLWKELRDSGRVRLGRFYARRIRRLLPAAFLVLLVALAGVLLLVPRGEWAVMLRDIWASAVYSVNWVLAASAVDYFAAEDAASPVQHYWSLSVEEQFYLVWPLVLMLAWLARRRWVLLATLGIVLAGSLAYSVVGAYQFQSFAYFATPAHAWEFALGGVAALALPRLNLRDGWWLTAASWTGWGAIVGAALLFDAASPFPGWIALLPVTGALLVIVAGTPRSPWSPSDIVVWRPVQFVGDISYSLYLWHWLPIVLLPYAFEAWLGRDYLTVREKLVVLVACVLLAWGTKVLVEDPVRGSTRWRLPRRTFIAAAAATAVTVAAAVTPVILLERDGAAQAHRLDALVAEAISEDGESCVGALSIDVEAPCPDTHLIAESDAIAYAAKDTEHAWRARQAEADPWFEPDCATSSSGNPVCRYGSAEADVRVALVGDSHAGHLTPALLSIAHAHGWAVDVWRVTECTPAVQTYDADEPDARADCQEWKRTIFDDVAASDADTVVTSSFTGRYTRWLRKSPGSVRAIETGFVEAWQVWRDAGKSVLAVSDTPYWRENVPRCITAALDPQRDPCTVEPAAVTFDDPLLAAVETSADPDIVGIDLSDVFCDESLCHPVVGGLVSTRDTTHMTASFATTLAPRIEEALMPLVRP